MAARKPLVLINGRIAQLPAGDTLAAQASEVDVVNAVNANAGALEIGTPVYISGAGAMDKAQANASGTTEVLGLIVNASIPSAASGSVQTNGVLPATTGQWDAVTGEKGGLTPNSTYYLDAANPGKLTQTPPNAVGEFIVRVGRALSTTEMIINPEPAIEL